MTETVFEELQRYVQFDPEDQRALRAFHPHAKPHFQRIAEVFYDRILDHAEARTVLTGGESQVGHLKVTLQAWMDKLLTGPWDEGYWQQRYKIGRVHVRIGMPQHYMFGGMNVIRTEFVRLVIATLGDRPAELERTRSALAKILDMELAVMLASYRDDLLSQAARAERLSTFGQLVGSIGHDLRNPLGVIETSLFILRGRIGTDDRAKKHVDRIGEQLGIANGIITNLLDMIRNKPLARERVSLAAVVGGAAEAVKLPPDVALTLDGVAELPDIEGDPGQLRQVFVNLIDNAVHAASPKGTVRVHGERADGLVELAVEDSGPGVDAATRRRLFEPLITTKDKGIGLGLALVKKIAERHGGTIEYADRTGGGARFVLRLPALRHAQDEA
jgi:two-component system, NtrC family, sensor histidine kinase HydH